MIEIYNILSYFQHIAKKWCAGPGGNSLRLLPYIRWIWS